jgi:hypothetical protein
MPGWPQGPRKSRNGPSGITTAGAGIAAARAGPRPRGTPATRLVRSEKLMTNPKDIFAIHRSPQVKARGRGRPFEKGCAPGPGRPKGSRDRMTLELRQALLTAVENVGETARNAGSFRQDRSGWPAATAGDFPRLLAHGESCRCRMPASLQSRARPRLPRICSSKRTRSSSIFIFSISAA